MQKVAQSGKSNPELIAEGRQEMQLAVIDRNRQANQFDGIDIDKDIEAASVHKKEEEDYEDLECHCCPIGGDDDYWKKKKKKKREYLLSCISINLLFM